MSDTLYTKDHEWIRVENGVGTIGITDYAQNQLGDVVFVELPDAGKVLEAGKELAVVESVKAASEVYAPVSGTVAEVNTKLADEPGTINSDPAGAGWFVKLSLADPSQLSGLLDEAGYQAYIADLG